MSRSATRRLIPLTGALATVSAVLASGSPASALASAAHRSAPVTFWVAPAGTPTGADTSCKTAAYSTVQSAVAAAGIFGAAHPHVVPTVNICPATYVEQVTITRSVELTRAPVARKYGPVRIELPASVGTDQKTGLSTTNCQAQDAAHSIQLPQSVIEICSAAYGGVNTSGVKVTIRDLTVAGNWPASVCYDSLYDILVEGGATLTLTGSTVERAGAYPLNGCQGGVGVRAGFSAADQIGHAILTGDTIESYQKNGVSIDGPHSTAAIDKVTVIGAGPTSGIAQNGIQISRGATGSVTRSIVSGNNYTGKNLASSAGILIFGGCGSGLVKHASITHNTLIGNDMGVALFNADPTCSTSPATATNVTACYNRAINGNGYPGGVPSADANISGWSATAGYQAGIYDVGNHDVVCHNAIYGAGYAPLGATSSLPNPPPPAFVRPVDIVSGPAISPNVYDNTYDGSPYHAS